MRKLVLGALAASALGMASAANAQLFIIPPTTVETAPVPVSGDGGLNFTSTYNDASAQTPFELLISFMTTVDGTFSFGAQSTANVVGGSIVSASDVDFSGAWISGLCSAPQTNPADATCSSMTHLADLSPVPGSTDVFEHVALTDLFLTAGSYTFHIAGTRGASSSFDGNLNFTPAAVPEPASWAMMLLGFGAIGWQVRRRRAPVLAQAA